jgi:hypothetical protein
VFQFHFDNVQFAVNERNGLRNNWQRHRIFFPLRYGYAPALL